MEIRCNATFRSIAATDRRSRRHGDGPPFARSPAHAPGVRTPRAPSRQSINGDCDRSQEFGNRNEAPTAVDMDKDHALEEMMGKLGDFGRYQCFQFILHILAAMTAGMHMLSLVTVAAVPEHRCWIEGLDTNESIAAWNSTEVLAAIPSTLDGRIHSCYMFNEFNETVKCSKWVFDTQYRSSSRAIEWDFVCDKRWMGAVAQTVYMLGVFTGAVVLGGMADKYGRKTIFCWSGVLQLIFGVVVAFIPEYWSFLVIRYLYAIFGSAGSYITGFVLTMEIVGSSKRTACGVAFQAAFALGIMLVAGWGALIDNRQILQIVYGLHSLLLIPHIWIMDESPRWLWAQGRAKEAVDIVQRALKFNRSDEVLDKAQLVSKGKVEASKDTDAPSAGTMDLFKTPNLRIKTINVCFCWSQDTIYGTRDIDQRYLKRKVQAANVN
ncbi:unnamed protein product, partial [Iphiclides podalirius]